jgi:hypothetical protein
MGKLSVSGFEMLVPKCPLTAGIANTIIDDLKCSRKQK